LTVSANGNVPKTNATMLRAMTNRRDLVVATVTPAVWEFMVTT
jgi:hypothetical protein